MPAELTRRYEQRIAAARAADPDADVSVWLLGALLSRMPARWLISGEPALHAAALVDTEIVADLLARGADVHARLCDADRPMNRFEGASVLHRATDPGIIRCLVAAGADLDAWTRDGEAPLHHACRDADPDRLEALLDAGASIGPTVDGVEPEALLRLPAQNRTQADRCRALLAAVRLARALPEAPGAAPRRVYPVG